MTTTPFTRQYLVIGHADGEGQESLVVRCDSQLQAEDALTTQLAEQYGIAPTEAQDQTYIDMVFEVPVDVTIIRID